MRSINTLRVITATSSWAHRSVIERISHILALPPDEIDDAMR